MNVRLRVRIGGLLTSRGPMRPPLPRNSSIRELFALNEFAMVIFCAKAR